MPNLLADVESPPTPTEVVAPSNGFLPVVLEAYSEDRIALRGTDKLTTDQWLRLEAVPGAHHLMEGRRGMLRHSITGLSVFEVRGATGGYPNPVLVPASQHLELEGLVDPEELKRVLNELRQVGVDLEPVQNPDPSKPLLPFQRETVKQVGRRSRRLIAAYVGAGKTDAGIATGETLLHAGLVDHVLVLAPKHLINETWRDFLRAWGQEPVILTGSPSDRKKIFPTLYDCKGWVLAKHDAFRLKDILEQAPYLLGPRSALIVEECHHFRSAYTQRYKGLKKALESYGPSPYRILLTGTTIYDKPKDLFGQLMLLYPPWNNYQEFKSRYFEEDTVTTRRTVREVQPDGQIVERKVPIVVTDVGPLKPGAGRYLNSVLDWLSYLNLRDDLNIPFRQIELRIEMEAEERRIYRQITRELSRASEEGRRADTLALIAMQRDFVSDPTVLLYSDSATAARLRESIGVERLQAVSPGSKLRRLITWLGDFIEDEPDDSKVIVFTPFTKLFRVIEDLLLNVETANLDGDEKEALKAIAPRIVYFDGDMNERAIGNAIDAFKHDPKIRIMMASDSGGQGQNFQDVCHTIVHYDQPLSLGQFTQRDGRAKRRGQVNGVFSYRFLLTAEEEWAREVADDPRAKRDPLIDEHIRHILDAKQRELDEVLTPDAPSQNI
jgi:SNF2 family DNA or RNA helicase